MDQEEKEKLIVIARKITALSSIVQGVKINVSAGAKDETADRAFRGALEAIANEIRDLSQTQSS